MSCNRPLFTVGWFASSLLLASCVQNQPSPLPVATDAGPQIRGALSGTKQLIANFYFVNPDCTSTGYPTLKVARAPQHGQVSVEQGTAFAEFAKDKPAAVCNGKKVPATLIYYTSEPGFIGADSVAFDRIGVAGAYGYHDYAINVR